MLANPQRHPEAVEALEILHGIEGVTDVDARHRRGAKIQIKFRFEGVLKVVYVGVRKTSGRSIRRQIRTLLRMSGVEVAA